MPEAAPETAATGNSLTSDTAVPPHGGASQQIALHVAAMLFGASALFGEHIAASSTLIVFGRGLFSWLSLSVIAIAGLAGMRSAARLSGGAPWQGLSCASALRLIVAGVLLAAHWLAFFLAIKAGGVAVGTLGFACFPAFVILLEWPLRRERPTLGDAGVIGLVCIGLALVTPAFDWQAGATVGLAWGVLSGAIYAVIALFNRVLGAQASPLRASWWQCLGILLVLGPFAWREALTLPAVQWGWLACLGVVCTALAYTLFIHALRTVKASQAAVVIALEPVYAIAFAWVLFGTSPTLKMAVGGVFIVGAVAWSGSMRSRRSSH
ncbi:EamA family transporter [Pandoraea fibrosis]|uniref:EamA family transporter n=1 Tax=Pandoraea fibrosis TaxID=1891094 RepID=A0ABX6HRA7_9BURK|nr:DMT family transporter [Pandoraea fibrosis]QHE93404.1 EamA family transporter [Pandoraea fibrosis]QHF13034.1 EamA family transporter [Pandoraea fibrosis]